MQPSFDINDINELLAELDNIPHRFARPIIDKIQTKWTEKMKAIQTNGATNPEVQAEINQVKANQD